MMSLWTSRTVHDPGTNTKTNLNTSQAKSKRLHLQNYSNDTSILNGSWGALFITPNTSDSIFSY